MSRSRRMLSSLVVIAFSVAAPLSAQQSSTPVSIMPSTPLGRWYATSSGYRPDVAAFGAYVMTAVDGMLYLGFGTAEPTAQDGALLAGYDGKRLRNLGTFSEQGLHQIVSLGSRLVIAGTDPSGGDDWSSGNVYRYTPGQPVEKFRSQPNVIHTWGLSGDGDVLYAAAAAHTGDGLTPEGNVLRSTNGGRDWQRMSAATNFSVQDIFPLGGALYATRYYADASWLKYHLRIARSVDQGATWTEISEIETSPTIRFVEIDGARVGADSARTSLVRIDPRSGVTSIPLPFRLQKYYHSLAVAGGSLYAITDDGRLMRSRDTGEWKEVARSTRALIALTYWPQRQSIVVSEQGTEGTIWMVGAEAGDASQPATILFSSVAGR